MSFCILSDMECSYSWMMVGYMLLFPPSIAFAIPAIDTGIGVVPPGPEESVQDIAVLTKDTLANLPSNFTICSSISTDAFTTGLSPFLMTRESGEPWITFSIWPPNKGSTKQRIQTKVVINLSTENALNAVFCRWMSKAA